MTLLANSMAFLGTPNLLLQGTWWSQFRELRDPRARPRHAPPPRVHPCHRERHGRQHVLQVRLRLPDIPTTPQPKRAHPLRQRSFHARPQRVLRLKLRRLLARPRRLQGRLLLLRAQREAPAPLPARRTLRLHGTPPALLVPEVHADHRRPILVGRFPPPLAGLPLWT